MNTKPFTPILIISTQGGLFSPEDSEGTDFTDISDAVVFSAATREVASELASYFELA